MAQLTVIIVNWNTQRLLAACLRSIATLPERSLVAQIVIVDNASTDDSLERAQAAATSYNLPTCFLALSHNVGFSRANNIGAATARREGTEPHLLFLNPDTELTPGSLQSLLEPLARYEKAGIVGPKIVNTNHSTQPSVRRLPKLTVLFFLIFKLHKLFPHSRRWNSYLQTDFDYSKRHVVEQVMGAAFLVRNRLWKEIGEFDERYWIWFEEVDYCQRAIQASWQVLYVPQAVVVHHGAQSFRQLGRLRRYLLFARSAVHYARKHQLYARQRPT